MQSQLSDTKVANLTSSISQRQNVNICGRINKNQLKVSVCFQNFQVISYFARIQQQWGISGSRQDLKISALMFIGCTDGSIKIISSFNQTVSQNFTGHRGVILNLKFHPNASKLALFSTAEDNVIKMWDLGLECCLTTFQFHKSPVASLAFTNDTNTLIAAGRDNKLSFWNLVDFTKIKSINLQNQVNDMLYLNPEEKAKKSSNPMLLIGGESGSLQLLNVNKQAFLQVEQQPLKQQITQIIKLQDNRIVAVTIDHNFMIHEIDICSGEIKKVSE